MGLYAGTKKVLACPYHHYALIARWSYYPERGLSRCPLHLYLVLGGCRRLVILTRFC